jgi:hypothetical protein
MMVNKNNLIKGPKTVVALFAYGGVFPQTHFNMIRDATRAAYQHGQHGEEKSWPLTLFETPQDALIERSRAICAKKFLATDSEVLIMIDHDLAWRGADEKADYEGDLLYLARRCHETRSIVGALVSKKARGQGVASMLKQAGELELGKDQLVESWYVGAAFTAYHRDVLQAVTDSMAEIPPGFTPIFMPFITKHPIKKDAQLHLSEDWAFVERARDLGFPCYATTMPLITHYGNYGYTVVGDSQPTEKQKVEQQKEIEEQHNKPVVTVLHATRGRANQAAESMKNTLARASGEYPIEYIFSYDSDDEKALLPDDELVEIIENAGFDKHNFNFVITKNENRGNVDAYNNALYQSEIGSYYMQGHDDMLPPENWDKIIVERLGDPILPRVLHTSDGTSCNPTKHWLIPVLIGTRAYFKECGYFFHPDYISIYCDDDQSLKAYKEEKVINAKDVTFAHQWLGPEHDETYKRSYKKSNWEHGLKVLERRQDEGFPSIVHEWQND